MLAQRDLRPYVREEPPPDHAVLVVRGGPVTIEKLRAHSQRTQRTFALDGQPVWGVSVFCALEESGAMSLDGILSGLLRSYPAVHLPRARTVLEAGFQLLPTFDRPHYTLRLSSNEDNELQKLVRTFGDRQKDSYYGLDQD